MTIFTTPPKRRLLTAPDEVSTSSVLGAAMRQALTDNPMTASGRLAELELAEQGLREAPGLMYAPAVASQMRPEERLPADVARERVGDFDIEIPDEGITESALNILLKRHKEQRERQAILSKATAWQTAGAFGAGLAASMTDPLNIASAFIPVVGPGRYARMLERAATPLARAGVRARVGGIEGAVGALAVEPLPLLAALQDQTDYGMADSLLNIAFGTILGGGLHAVGGAVVDRANPRADTPEPLPSERIPAAARAETPEQAMVRRFFEEADQARLRDIGVGINAKGQAQQELIPQLIQELEPQAVRPEYQIPVLRKELKQIENDLSRLDDSFRDRAKEAQTQGRTRKEAERAARESIERDRAALTEQADTIRSRIEENRQAELAKRDLGVLRRGDIPERFQAMVQARADEITRAFQKNPVIEGIRTASEQVRAAPFRVRQDALRSAVAQAVTGKPIDVEPVFRSEPYVPPRVEQSEASIRADREVAQYREEISDMQAQIDEELALAEQAGVAIDTAAVDAEVARAQAYGHAFETAAVCMRAA